MLAFGRFITDLVSSSSKAGTLTPQKSKVPVTMRMSSSSPTSTFARSSGLRRCPQADQRAIAAAEATDDASSSGGDIPSRKDVKKAAAKQIQEELKQAREEDEDEEDADECVIPESALDSVMDDVRLTIEADILRSDMSWSASYRILSTRRSVGHKEGQYHPSSSQHFQGQPLYLVKWKDYPDSDNTEEPEANLADCKELETYFQEIGGRPANNKSNLAMRTDGKKRKLSVSAADTPPSATSRGKGAKKAKDETPFKQIGKKGTKEEKSGEFRPPSGSWEDAIIGIDTMEMGDDGLIYVYVVWKQGNHSKHPTSVTNAKCPQKVSH